MCNFEEYQCFFIAFKISWLLTQTFCEAKRVQIAFHLRVKRKRANVLRRNLDEVCFAAKRVLYEIFKIWKNLNSTQIRTNTSSTYYHNGNGSTWQMNWIFILNGWSWISTEETNRLLEAMHIYHLTIQVRNVFSIGKEVYVKPSYAIVHQENQVEIKKSCQRNPYGIKMWKTK